MTFDEALIDALSKLGWEQFRPRWYKRSACLEGCCWLCVSIDEINERFCYFEHCQTDEPCEIGVRYLEKSQVGPSFCWRICPVELPEDDEARAVALAFLCDQVADKNVAVNLNEGLEDALKLEDEEDLEDEVGGLT